MNVLSQIIGRFGELHNVHEIRERGHGLLNVAGALFFKVNSIFRIFVHHGALSCFKIKSIATSLWLLFHQINPVQNGSASSSAVAVKDCRFAVSSSSFKVTVHLIGFALRCGPFSVSSFNDARC